MQHSVAIRTDWNKVFRGVNQVAGAKFRYGHNMVNVNEIAANVTISFLKQKTTDLASRTLNRYAKCAVKAVAFISVDFHPLNCAFRQPFGRFSLQRFDFLDREKSNDHTKDTAAPKHYRFLYIGFVVMRHHHWTSLDTQFEVCPAPSP